jgi:2-phospho-L-lactate transferase/gluconeogenesis factor (CofD/UPF0052 family)
MFNVVQFSGGRGTKAHTRAFLKRNHSHLTLVVNAYDDGKSTGAIRRIFRMLGPSDIRKNQEEMLFPYQKDYEAFRQLFAWRYPIRTEHDAAVGELQRFARGEVDTLCECSLENDGARDVLRRLAGSFVQSLLRYEVVHRLRLDFGDCSIMNCLYAGAYELCNRDFAETTVFFDRFFQIQGTVLPTSLEDQKLVAIRESGEVLYSEAEIVELRSNVRIRDIFIVDEYPDREILETLSPEERYAYLSRIQARVRATDEVVRAIGSADIIVYGPGTQHSSLYPSYMTRGIPEAIVGNRRAVKIFVCNIGEDYETPEYTASELVKGALRHLQRGAAYPVTPRELMDFVLVNDPRDPKLAKYIPNDLGRFEGLGVKVICDDFEDPMSPGKHNGEKIVDLCFRFWREALEKRLG